MMIVSGINTGFILYARNQYFVCLTSRTRITGKLAEIFSEKVRETVRTTHTVQATKTGIEPCHIYGGYIYSQNHVVSTCNPKLVLWKE